MPERSDVVITGTGAGGGTLANTIAAVNPALTAMANGIRASEQLLERLG